MAHVGDDVEVGMALDCNVRCFCFSHVQYDFICLVLKCLRCCCAGQGCIQQTIEGTGSQNNIILITLVLVFRYCIP